MFFRENFLLLRSFFAPFVFIYRFVKFFHFQKVVIFN